MTTTRARDPQEWLREHLGHAEPLHRWQPRWAVVAVHEKGFLCTNCMRVAQIGETVPLPCVRPT